MSEIANYSKKAVSHWPEEEDEFEEKDSEKRSLFALWKRIQSLSAESEKPRKRLTLPSSLPSLTDNDPNPEASNNFPSFDRPGELRKQVKYLKQKRADLQAELKMHKRGGSNAKGKIKFELPPLPDISSLSAAGPSSKPKVDKEILYKRLREEFKSMILYGSSDMTPAMGECIATMSQVDKEAFMKRIMSETDTIIQEIQKEYPSTAMGPMPPSHQSYLQLAADTLVNGGFAPRMRSAVKTAIGSPGNVEHKTPDKNTSAAAKSTATARSNEPKASPSAKGAAKPGSAVQNSTAFEKVASAGAGFQPSNSNRKPTARVGSASNAANESWKNKLPSRMVNKPVQRVASISNLPEPALFPELLNSEQAPKIPPIAAARFSDGSASNESTEKPVKSMSPREALHMATKGRIPVAESNQTTEGTTIEPPLSSDPSFDRIKGTQGRISEEGLKRLGVVPPGAKCYGSFTIAISDYKSYLQLKEKEKDGTLREMLAKSNYPVRVCTSMHFSWILLLISFSSKKT